MGIGPTLLLGLIAGSTILIGLPIGRLRSLSPQLRQLLNAIAVGVLLFLLWDILAAAWEPIDSALTAIHDGTGGLGPVFGYGALFAGGLAVGLLSLVAYESYLHRAAQPSGRGGPGAMSVEEVPPRHTGIATWSPARRLALLIAIGIGLHNFAEGLAIGQSAARNDIGLAALLVIGFALHNATEGFGIVAPLAAERNPDGSFYQPSWAFLLTIGDHRRRPHVPRHGGRSRVHQRARQRGLPHPGRRIDPLRRVPTARRRRSGQAAESAGLRAADRAIGRIPHRRHRHRRRRLTPPGGLAASAWIASPAARPWDGCDR